MVTLRGLKIEGDLKEYTLLRQNEPDDVVIYIKIPERGLYALDLHGKRWGDEGSSCPLIATYLIAATTAAHNLEPYPRISGQKSGQCTANLQ